MQKSKFMRSKVIVLSILLTIAVSAVIVAVIFSSNKANKEPNTVYVSGLLVPKNIDQLISQSRIIVRGTIDSVSDAFQIKHVSDSISNFTDYTVAVDSVLRGEAQENDITVRVQGGTVNGYTELHEQSPVLQEGKEYLLFLYHPGRGGSYNTDGDYYYVLGLVQGVFTEDAEGNYIPQLGDAISSDALQAKLTEYENIPIDPLFFRNEYMENQSGNVETGFITEEEYQQLMSNIDVFAEIVK
jgi:hypothetical protein